MAASTCSIHVFVSFISLLLSMFVCCSQRPRDNKNNDNNNNNNNNYSEISDDNDKELIVSSFISSLDSSINTDEFFCGSIPTSIMDLCCKYYNKGNSQKLDINKIIKNIKNNIINSDDKEKKIEFEFNSSPFDINNGCIFQNIICIEYDKPLNQYEISYYLQLIKLPQNINNITINYKLSSLQIDIEWQNIATLKVGDVVGTPSAFYNNNQQDINQQDITHFTCDVNVILFNGRSPSHSIIPSINQ